MSDEQINIAIVEACGWECGHDYRSHRNYCKNLNAMHEAEKTLSDWQVGTYVATLCLEVQPEPKLYHATARQKAEAFLRTLGKWEE